MAGCMITKKMILFLFFTVSSVAVHAQWYAGIEGGTSLNYLLTNITNRVQQQINQHYDPGFGASVMIPVQYQHPLCKHSAFSVSSGINVIQKSYFLNRTDGLTYLNEHVRNDYLQVPLSISYVQTIRCIHAFLSGGIYGAYWAEGHIQGQTATQFDPHKVGYDEQYTFNSLRDNQYEWGWFAGGGISSGFTFFKIACEPFLRLNFYQSQQDQQKQYMIDQIPKYNSTYVLSFGTLINLHHVKKEVGSAK